MKSAFCKLASLPVLLALLIAPALHAEDALPVIMWDDLQPAANELDRQSESGQSENNNEAAEYMQSPASAQMSGAVVPELDGKRVKIPAYVVALDGDQNSLTELLLVPYFGACVHVPPPPPNQIIHIQDNDGVAVGDLDLYNPVWAIGTIRTEPLSHEIAEIGYRMEVEELIVYDPKDNPRVKK